MNRTCSILVVLLGTISCHTGPVLEKKAPPQSKSTATPRPVATICPAAGQGIEATGTALPIREALLSAAVPGRITEIPVTLGQKVKKGQSLVRLDPYGFSLAVQQAEAGLAAATVQVEQANRELERAQRLVGAKVAPGATYEQVQAAYQGVVAQKKVAEAGLKQAKKALGDSTVRAPFDGTVDMIIKQVGEYAPSMPPTMLVKLVDASSLEVQLFLPEIRAGEITTGSAAQVRIDSAGVESTGEVIFVSNRVQPGTQTFEARVRIPNPDEKIKAGAFARVSFAPSEAPSSIVLPTRVVQQGDDGTFVWVVEDNVARRVPVTLGQTTDDGVVVTGGLDRNRPVIISGLSGISDGDPVTAEKN